MSDEFEKLGAFYLGKEYDHATKKRGDGLVLYDSKDLCTHAVCVGMTGSGKTGLCIGLLEEAAIDNIPAIVIDPKGDLSNLLLTFPKLQPSDFRPWINIDDAAKKNLTPDQFAEQQARLWTDGLASWGQSGERIQKLRDTADFVVYTPGSSAGRQVSILKSLSVPDASIVEDNDLLQERIGSTVTSLLGLLGIDADPIQSREHILLSTIFTAAWKEGRELSLEQLITQIQQPPFGKVGVISVDTFYPPKERSTLAMKLNNLLAAPGFASWLAGDPLDIDAILHAASGKPKVSIFSISHLSDAERMFFVSLLLNQVIGWMRGQSGTTSLRAVVYMDEIAGYFPPIKNPPSKGPLLTLMKQARAFGVGVVLATQNPVDLDYKGLSNAGTWFIGRLQTERDKLRVLDGLAGASAEAGVGFDRATMSELLSTLGNRIFLMNNVHDAGPQVFETRWTMSYLRGPLTRNQLKVLTRDQTAAVPETVAKPMNLTAVDSGGTPAGINGPAATPTKAAATAKTSTGNAARSATGSSLTSSARPYLPPTIRQAFLPICSAQPAGASLLYRPALLAFASVYFQDTKTGVDVTNHYIFSAPRSTAGHLDWTTANVVNLPADGFETEPHPEASFTAVPDDAANPKNYSPWIKQITDAIFRQQRLELLKNDRLDELAKPGESERDFRLRLTQAAHEQRDIAVEKLRQKYAPKVAALQERLRRAQAAVDAQKAQARTSTFQTAVSFGASVLGMFVGRKQSTVGRATTAARGVGRSAKEYSDVSRAQESVEAVHAKHDELNAQFQAEAAALAATYEPTAEPLSTVSVRPKKSNITIDSIQLCWMPYWSAADGTTTAAWE